MMCLFPMTSDEFCKLPESDTVQLELLDGEVFLMPRATLFHQYFWFELSVILRAWVNKKRLGRVLLDTLMKLDGKWTPAPDIAFIARRHLGRAKEKRIEGPVDLAIELLSRGTINVDRKLKFAAYAKYAIPWYWIVDLKARVLEEYELVDGKYANLVRAPFDEPFKPRLFPGLVIDLASLEW
jgi:Uma2 family endonuclease